MIYFGLDPGKGGGIAAVDDEGVVLLKVAMPMTERDLLSVLCEGCVPEAHVGGTIDWGQPRARAVLERVHASPQMGVSSAFTFGCHRGMLLMALVAAQIPFDEVSPQRWQQAMGCRLGGKGFGQRNATAAKNLTKRRAQELFPRETITHKVADALLLAEFGRRWHMGLVSVRAAWTVEVRP